ncbi:hypothetical protein [Dactylosporangium sp. NPDC048998]|uniref:hypothetical protein n=1 Tax=Dactylosporangium sp. NPDC048998 TaxID=3363976 RepID=UPI0037243DE5
MMVNRPRRALAVLAAAGLLAVPLTPTAAAADPSPSAVTWTVQPADQGGPDGRRWIERTLDPGQVVTEHLAVRNLSKTEAVFALSAADGYLTEKGRFNMLPSDQPSKDGGTWIAVQHTVTVAANETKVVPFTVTVPGNATPGDHPAGIAASILSSSGTVQVESRVGFRVLLRASGTARAALSAERLTAQFERSWNPLRPGAVHVTYSVANTGNVRVDARADAAVAELFGAHRRTAAVDAGELLPGGGRTVGTRVSGVWGLGRVRTTVTLTPAVLGDTGPGLQATPTVVDVTGWIVPWPQLVLAAVLAALVLAIRTVVRRRRRRLTAMLARARQEGRQAALAGGAQAEG